MIHLSAKVTSTFSPAKIAKQIDFGTIRGLTKTAKDAQAAAQDSIKDTFTVRGNWWQQSNKYGIKITPATKARPYASVHTIADWLEKQRKGGNVFPFGRFLAIPTSNVRRNKRQIVTKAQRPRNLKKAFIITTSKNKVNILFQRKGRGKSSDLVAMYVLVPKVGIKPTDAFYGPIRKLVDRRLAKNVRDGIQDALKNIKP